MKKRIIKGILLILGLIPVLTLVVHGFDSDADFVSGMIECIEEFPLVLLGLIPLFIWIFLYFSDLKKNKGKEVFYKKIWTSLLITGIVILLIPFISGLESAIFGLQDCFMECSDTYSYGFDAFYFVVVIYIFLLWPIFVIAIALIVLSLIKLKKYKNKK